MELSDHNHISLIGSYLFEIDIGGANSVTKSLTYRNNEAKMD